ncbi:MAG: molybdate ABC transporter substrate-binding protein [bacterium]
MIRAPGAGRAAWTLAAVLVTASCTRDAGPEPLIVFAAASTADVLGPIARATRGIDVRLSVGPSSALARQIMAGAPAGVFVSASAAWIAELERSGVTEGEALLLAGNRVVCVVAPGARPALGGVGNALELAQELEPHDLVAVADSGVPVGEYARLSLRAEGAWEGLAGHLVGQADARDCLRLVQRGEAVAGFVYATDARAGGLAVLFELDRESHEAVQVWAVAISKERAARDFLERLAGKDARASLIAAGFLPPGQQP